MEEEVVGGLVSWVAVEEGKPTAVDAAGKVVATTATSALGATPLAGTSGRSRRYNTVRPATMAQSKTAAIARSRLERRLTGAGEQRRDE